MARKPYLNSYTNGEYDVDFKSELIPTGTITLTQNGSYNVGTYESAVVNVEGGGGSLDDIEELVTMSASRTLEYNFAYAELPHAMIALVVDDCLPGVISTCVTNAAAKNIPLGMSAISSEFPNMCTKGDTSKTVLQEILRGVENGGEVYLHGNGSITADNIGNESFLKSKFLDEKLVFNDNGLYPKGAVVIGGGSEIYNDSRTDRWVRALYDFSDGWGIGEPYSHRRLAPTTLEAAKAYIDDAVANNKFIIIFAHKWYDFWNDMIDYAEAQGAEFVKWSSVVYNYSERSYEGHKTLTSISATKTKTSYTVGETFSTSDVVVTAHYSDDTTEVVTSSATIGTVDTSTEGSKTLSISYAEDDVTVSTSIAITVSASPSGTIVYQVASITGTCNGSTDQKVGSSSTSWTSGHQYKYEFDYEVTAVADATTNVKIRDAESRDLGIDITNATVGQTGHCSRTNTMTQTRNRQAFLLKADGKSYTVKLTNVVVTDITESFSEGSLMASLYYLK